MPSLADALPQRCALGGIEFPNLPPGYSITADFATRSRGAPQVAGQPWLATKHYSPRLRTLAGLPASLSGASPVSSMLLSQIIEISEVSLNENPFRRRIIMSQRP